MLSASLAGSCEKPSLVLEDLEDLNRPRVCRHLQASAFLPDSVFGISAYSALLTPKSVQEQGELPWILRSNAKISRIEGDVPVTPANTEFFNSISRFLPVSID